MKSGAKNFTKLSIVDDDADFLDSLRTLMSLQHFDVATFNSVEAFLKAAPKIESGAVLIDVNMPGRDGISLLDELKRTGFGPPCIMMTGFGQVSVAVKAMKLGAFDFIEKPFDNEALVALLHRASVSGNDKSVSSIRADAAKEKVAALTPREQDVLALLAKGEPNKIIAHELGISPRTVEIHRARLMEKLSAGSVADVVRLAIDAGVLS